MRPRRSTSTPLGVAAASWAGSRRVTAGEFEVRYREAGTGLPVVLVHGLGVSADYWRRNGPPLAEAGFRVLAPDLPGFGRSTGAEEALSIRGQAAALARWAQALEIGPAVYVGHSLSCQTILELATREPERVLGLVLAAPTGDPNVNQRPRQLWRLFRDAWREPLPLVTVVATAYLRAGVVRVWQTWKYGTEHDPLAILPQVQAPSVVVVGTRDPVVEDEFACTLAEGLPEGRIARIEGAAHAVHFDRPDEFNRAVTTFLHSLPPPAVPRVPRPGAEREARGAP